jgi:hypothetical protein
MALTDNSISHTEAAEFAAEPGWPASEAAVRRWRKNPPLIANGTGRIFEIGYGCNARAAELRGRSYGDGFFASGATPPRKPAIRKSAC